MRSLFYGGWVMNKKIFAIIVLFLCVFATSSVYASLDLKASTANLNSDTQINLSWNSVANASYYKVYRATKVYGSDTPEQDEYGNDVLISTINVDIEKNYLSFEDTGLLPETGYKYTVSAIKINSSEEEVIQFETKSISTNKMLMPSIVSWNLDLNNNIIKLKWVNNSFSITSTTIYRKVDGEVNEIANLDNDGDFINFFDESISPGITSKYTVTSFASNDKQASSSFEITPIKLPKLNAKLEKNNVKISWEEHPQIQDFKLEKAKYIDESWGNWEVIDKKLEKDSKSIIDKLEDGGIYRYRLKIDTENFTGVSNISKPITRISLPSNFQCVPISPGRIDLSWSNLLLYNSTIQIQRKDSSSSSYQTIETVDSNITSYSDTYNIESNKTYYYRLVVKDSDNNENSTRDYRISTNVPNSAKYLTVDITSPTSFTLNWQDNSNNESGFIVERRTGDGSFVEIATVPANTGFYLDSTVTSSSNYTYRVIAFNPFGKSHSYTNEITSSASLIIEPPASLTVTPVSSKQIDLSWEYADYSNHSTAIERKSGKDGDWQIVDILDTGFSSYSDTNLSSDTEYFYRVKAVISENVFSRPHPREEAGTGVYTKLLMPMDLKASWQSSGIIKLEWSGILSFESDLVIERKTENSNFVPIETISPYNLKWYDIEVENDRNYTYRVKSVNSYNSSDYSNEALVEPLALPEPGNFKVVVLSDSEVIIEWEYNTKLDISGFKLERRLDPDGRWREIVSLDKRLRSYTVKDLDADEVYYFRIGAYDSSMNLKSYTQPIEVLINTVKPPSDLVVTQIPNNQYLLEWKDNSDNEEGFIIERRHGSKDFVEIGRVTENTQSFIDSGLEFNSIYYYKVRAYNSNVQSTHSNTVSVRTLLQKTFSDLNTVPWARTAINSLLGMDIISGRSEDIFAPDDRITRAEFISLVVNAFELNKTPIGTFSDVRPEHWYYRNVMIAKNMGIVSGVGNNYFYPNEPIKREDMAVILARTLRITGSPLPHRDNSILDKFSDRHLISDYALSSLAVTHGAGIINGKGNDILAPKQLATRAEAAVMLYNVLFKLN